MEAPNLVQFENGAYFDLGEFSNLTLNQMNFSGGSAALVDTYQSKRIFAKWSNFYSSLEKVLLFLFLPLFFAKSFSAVLLTLLRVARKPSSVGWPTPKTGKPFTYEYETLYYITFQVRSFFFCEIVFSQNFVHLPKVGCPFHLLHFFRQKVHPWVRK